MGKATEIILSYSKGEITVEEANKRLAECTVGLRLDPMKNAITGAEMAQTRSDAGGHERIRLHGSWNWHSGEDARHSGQAGL